MIVPFWMHPTPDAPGFSNNYTASTINHIPQSVSQRTGNINNVVDIAVARYSDDLEIWTYLHIAKLMQPDIL
jgi:hypothetical protein